MYNTTLYSQLLVDLFAFCCLLHTQYITQTDVGRHGTPSDTPCSVRMMNPFTACGQQGNADQAANIYQYFVCFHPLVLFGDTFSQRILHPLVLFGDTFSQRILMYRNTLILHHSQYIFRVFYELSVCFFCPPLTRGETAKPRGDQRQPVDYMQFMNNPGYIIPRRNAPV